jgi:hypothetical protein
MLTAWWRFEGLVAEQNSRRRRVAGERMQDEIGSSEGSGHADPYYNTDNHQRQQRLDGIL